MLTRFAESSLVEQLYFSKIPSCSWGTEGVWRKRQWRALEVSQDADRPRGPWVMYLCSGVNLLALILGRKGCHLVNGFLHCFYRGVPQESGHLPCN